MIGSSVQFRVVSGFKCLSVGIIAASILVAATDSADAARRRTKAVKRAPVAAYSPPTAAIVVDAANGRILYAQDADATRYPASVTKVMTLYLLFEELEAGRMTLDTPLTVSKFAASQSPSKLGLRPGSTIRAEDAIKALVTKSANDIAVTVAENIAGSEPEFAERMTRKARAIGMTGTQYRNASGLPNKGQLTTARDLAILGIKIQERFPTYYKYFSTRVFTYAGRAMGNHNKLLGRVEGVDGIKTGFVNASGFNISTSVRREGRHIVAVVMGGTSGGSRDNRMKKLIEDYLPKASISRDAAPALVAAGRVKPAVVAETAAARPQATSSTTTPSSASTRTPEPAQARIAAAPVPVPPPAQPAPARTSTAELTTASVRTPAPVEAPVPVPAPQAAPVAAAPAPAMAYASAEPVLAPSLRWIVGAKPANSSGLSTLVESSGEARTAAAPVKKPRRVEVASLETGSAYGEPPVALPVEAAPEPAPAAAAEEAAAQRPGWFVQIGATPDAEKARALLDRAQRASSVLAGAEPFTEQVTKDSSTLFRARFAGLDRKSAQQACAALKRADMNCFPIKN
jgi:D-alanyl-D-alanine carboxypeptidase